MRYLSQRTQMKDTHGATPAQIRPAASVIPIERVVPVSLMTKKGSSQLYHLLRSYKSPYTSGTQFLVARVASLIGRFLRDHQVCLARGESEPSWDLVTTVPSTKGKRDHPLTRASRRLCTLGLEQPYADLLAPGSGPFERQARDDMFTVTQNVAGARVLLLDDTLVSGAHLQSAASALHLAGAKVTAAVVLGRIIDPHFNAACSRIWEWSSSQSFSFDICCLCHHDAIFGNLKLK
jgi:phosphoribosylpyrophosphate synthetase